MRVTEKLRIWLRGQREDKQLTMRDLAALLNRPHSFVAKVEQGERRLDVVEYVTYCRSLDVSPFEGMRASFKKADLT